MNDTPLKLFWWAAKPNFGDALSQIVTQHAAGRPVVHAGPREAEMFALGSILQIARRVYGKPDHPKHRPVIWGSGMMSPIRTAFLDHVDVAMVRGPITASLLGLDTELYGDPGLLTADALGPVDRHDRTGLLLHHSQLGHPEIAALIENEPSIEYIDVRQGPEEVCRAIGACRHVISSSLHGLIVADAYGVQNTWLDPMSHGRLKYYDYAASIARPLGLPMRHEDIRKALPGLPDGPLAYTDGINKAKHDLMTHFPAALRATVPAQ